MSRFVVAVSLVAALAAGSANAQTIGDVLKGPAPKEDPIVAKVDSVEIRRSDIVKTLESLPPQVQQMPMQQVYPVLIERMIDSKLIAREARKTKLEQDPDVKRRVADFEDRVLQEVFLDRSVRAKIDDKAINERYQEFLKSNPPQEEVHARHILVADEKKAKEVIEKLKKGEDFAALAKANSSDGSANEGGDLGFFTKDMMVPEFADAAFLLKAGEFTQEPVKTQFGFHVIKLEQRRLANPPSLEEVKGELTADMTQEKIQEVVGDLRKGAKVETFDIEGKPLGAPKP
jgi:peptidyl-prolyl cis-trans isomerase C